MSIDKVFDENAEDYDSARKQLIPCYDDFYQTAIEVIPYQLERELRILDIGAGTGILSEKLLDRYPRSTITLIDASAKMLAMAEKRLSVKYQNRVSYNLLNYADSEIKGTYDLIVSALSIHHLNDYEKERFYHKVHNILEQGGFFINCDQVLGENDVAEKLYHHNWLQQVRNRGVSEIALIQALERMKEDKMSTLSAQLDWLRKVDFIDITVWYKSFSFVVFSGTKNI